ncbi:hypothetical protein [Microtetraspora malaysiensis]|uniref:Secreted protein n=1 Tax=Microtetraspora malaysiensis TaxID=161358 RepID=A0ABW6T690_9ACTN
MKKRTTAMLVAGLTVAAGLVASSPAYADPSFPCGLSSAKQSGVDLSLHYHNCGSTTVKRKPFSVLYGGMGSCKSISAGATVGWIVQGNAHPDTWSVIAC